MACWRVESYIEAGVIARRHIQLCYRVDDENNPASSKPRWTKGQTLYKRLAVPISLHQPTDAVKVSAPIIQSAEREKEEMSDKDQAQKEYE